MVKSGEESGKLTDTFLYLADYIERSYEMISKTRNALVYPVFVIFTFIVVIVLMLTMVIPRLSEILLETGQDIPFYTKAVIALSNLFTGATGFVLLAIAVIGIGVLVYSSQTKSGQKRLDALKLQIPYISNLYNKLYLSRIADNMNTMLSAGIPVVRALEITRDVVDNKVYSDILDDAVEAVRGGSAISTAFAEHEQMPPIMVQMVKVGEETGSLGEILKTLARFYKREVDSAIDTLIGLIEPVLIIVLAIAVGFLITSILLPIYNIAGSL
jgi:type IV pilus assembly protein PilC